jgi:hypothetical protein
LRAWQSRCRVLGDDVEHGLIVRRRAGDDVQDLAGRFLPLQALRQALLEVADSRAVVLRQPLLASLGTAIDDRLGERAHVGKGRLERKRLTRPVDRSNESATIAALKGALQ